MAGVAYGRVSVSGARAAARAEASLLARCTARRVLPRYGCHLQRRRVRCAASGVRARGPLAAARPFACAPAMDAISPFWRPAVKAGQRRATVSARRVKPRSSLAAIWRIPRPRPESPTPNCRTRSRLQRAGGGMHLQWQGPDRACAGQDENNTTLRKGDIVAGANGLMVAGRGSDRRGAALNSASVPDQRALSARAGGGSGLTVGACLVVADEISGSATGTGVAALRCSAAPTPSDIGGGTDDYQAY